MPDKLAHKKTSNKTDDADTTLVRPVDWNDEHILTGGADGNVMKRDTGSSGGWKWDTLSVILDSFPVSGLPPAGNTGRLARLTDLARGIIMDQGTQWFNTNMEIANVREFGATGDGSTDDTLAIQTALNTGRPIFLPHGDYITSSALTVTHNFQAISGSGPGSRIITKSVTADVFLVGNGTNDIINLLFKDFALSSTVTKNSGFAFNARRAVRSRWENIWIGPRPEIETTNRLYNGYYFNLFDHNVVSGGIIIVQGTGIQARGNSDGLYGAELTINGGFRILSATYGMVFGGATGGIRIDDGDIIVCTNGIVFDVSLQAGMQNREAFLGSKLSIDSCAGAGIRCVTGGLARLEINGTWISSNVTGLILDVGFTGLVKASGATIYNNSGSGIEYNGGELCLSGGDISNNGSHGIINPNTAISRFLISNVRIVENGGYGISVADGPADFIIQGNMLYGNSSGNIQNPGGNNSTHIIRDNLGYQSENSALVDIPIGEVSITVAHGLSEVPSIILVTPLGSQPEGIIWVTDINATNFKINISPAAGANRSMEWRASLLGN